MTPASSRLPVRAAAVVAAAALFAAGAASARPAPDGFADLVEALSPSVVAVTTERARGERARGGDRQWPFAMPRGLPFREFFGRRFGRRGEDGARPLAAAGSGFIVDPDGYIVTNHHVIEGAEDIAVTLASGERLEASLAGADPKTDLALLKVEAAEPLPALQWGDSDAVRVGDWSLAIGNPFGLGGTVTAGIVSGRARDIDAGPFDDFLQTDAPINPGNSGGPLFDLDGAVIGVNTAILSPSGGNVGIGFAIPAALAEPVVAQLREHGRAIRGWLGVGVQRMTDDLAAGLDIAEARGALVAATMPGSPAAAAGIEAGDAIVAYDGKSVGGPRRLARLVSETPAGETVTVAVLRGVDEIRLEVEIARLAETADAAPPAAMTAMASAESGARLGLAAAPAAEGGLTVVAVTPGGPAARAGLRPGDIVREANRRPVDDTNALDAALAEAEAQGREVLLLLIERDGAPQFRAAPLGVG